MEDSIGGGGGIDGAVNALGGDELLQARFALPLLSEHGYRCYTGDAKMTVAGRLPCSYVIHAVGPNLGLAGRKAGMEYESDLMLLESAYKTSMNCAREKNLKSIGFCIISGGIYRGRCPLERVVLMGLRTIAKNAYPGLETVVFCGFTHEEKKVLFDVAKAGLPY